ncbi:MAG: helix-turn-helix domain-containing protein [Bacillota bacterium]|nr:helix-turn-helix domain-containing protein [Bacillota bacterium]
MFCDICGKEVPEAEVEYHAELKLCEDCFVEALSVPKACNPMAVRSARITRENQGQQGTAGLLPIQEEICRYVKEKKQTTRPDVCKHFNLSPKELEKHFVVLRHCELVRAFKEGNEIYLTTF